MEVMGLHLPGSSFVNPDTPLRTALTAEAGRRVTGSPPWATTTPRSARSSTNARSSTAASRCSRPVAPPTTPCTWWPSPSRGNHADLGRHFRAVDGRSAAGPDLPERQGGREPLPRRRRARLTSSHAARCRAAARGRHRGRARAAPLHAGAQARRGRRDVAGRTAMSLDTSVLRGVEEPFDADGGLKTLAGNLGSCVIKTSAVEPEHRVITAPARVFDDQADFLAAFAAGELDGDLVAVLRYQGPRAIGMPELHKLTPALGCCRTADTGRAGHRRPDVRGVRQGSGRDPPHPGSRHGRTDRPGSRRRHHHRRRRRGHADRCTFRRRVRRRTPTGRAPTQPTMVGTGRELFATCAPSSVPPTRAPASSPLRRVIPRGENQ